MFEPGALLCLSLAIASLAMGMYSIYKYHYAHNNWMCVPGTITRYDFPSNDLYMPTVQYTTEEGEEKTIRGKFYLPRDKYPIGCELEILYDPDNTNKFMIKGRASMGGPILYTFIGIALLIVYFYYSNTSPGGPYAY